MPKTDPRKFFHTERLSYIDVVTSNYLTSPQENIHEEKTAACQFPVGLTGLFTVTKESIPPSHAPPLPTV